ncbi:MAG: hypothetical protein ACKO1M_00055 [Planctomycetota bacterium]
MVKWVAISLAMIAGLAATRADDPLVVAFADQRTNFFTGREATVGVVVRGDAFDGPLSWMLSVGNRPLARGTAAVRHVGPDPTRVDVTLAIPEGRAGIVIDAILTVSLSDGGDRWRGGTTKVVRLFPADPFADRRRWLESRQIALVDPVGRTAAAFEAANVPFTPVPADLAIAAIRPPVIVVGEGLSWDERPGLAADLAFVASRGVGVLCLGPRAGAMPLPGTADQPGEVVARSLVLRRADVVAELDGRLDWLVWSAAGNTSVSRITVLPDGVAVLVQAGDSPVGWPWLEATFARREADPPAGKLVICGLGIVTHWNETPAARYLFAVLLERLTRSTPVPPGGDPAAAPPPADDPPINPPPENER